LIGKEHPPYVIAEISGNHNQSFEQAAQLIQVAARAGADAVKLQTYTADTITINCNNQYFQVGDGMLWKGRNLYDLYAEAFTPWEWQPKLQKIAADLGISLFSTPFDPTSVDFLEGMDVPAYKIASFELNDLPLIHQVAKLGKPVILSTGMATLEEIDAAVNCIRETGNLQIALLKCTSAYPAIPDEMNLRTIPDMSERFNVPIGVSDHTLGIAIPVVAVALGACIVEKHITLSRAVPGPDSAFSLEPEEFRLMVSSVKDAKKSLGRINYDLTDHEIPSRAYRRSLFVVRNVNKGEVLTRENIRSIRPGNGISPGYLNDLIGKKAIKFLERGTPLQWDMVE
jgi:pseudaminic acid synthase